MNNHGLRTTGTHTGNFGRQKVQGRPGTLDLTKEILSKDNLRIPNREDGFTLLRNAYNQTEDPRMKKVLGEMLRAREATLKQPQVKSMDKPPSPYWNYVKETR
jgi:hypothetical protein